MLATLMRTEMGGKFVEFMRGPSGKKIDKFLVEKIGFSLLMRVFSAKVGFPPIPVLMLYTIGHKSGEERSTVMPYLEFNHRLYLIGSNGAKAKPPAWVNNILANPDVKVVIGRRKRRVRGRLVEVGSAERDQVWAFAATKTPQYNTYQSKMTRPCPVIALE
jgi:deazaflavin-dependent oxidoreductase (nitroreductase family)